MSIKLPPDFDPFKDQEPDRIPDETKKRFAEAIEKAFFGNAEPGSFVRVNYWSKAVTLELDGEFPLEGLVAVAKVVEEFRAELGLPPKKGGA